jgi:hypothetical protein
MLRIALLQDIQTLAFGLTALSVQYIFTQLPSKLN